jgi:hypothetical protein
MHDLRVLSFDGTPCRASTAADLVMDLLRTEEAVSRLLGQQRVAAKGMVQS